MKCQAYREEIEESNSGADLSEGTRRHIGLCEACAQFYQGRMAVRGLLNDLARVSAPSDFEFKLRARMHRGQDVRGRGFLSRLFTPAGASAVAACVAIALTAHLYFRSPFAPQEVATTTPRIEKSSETTGISTEVAEIVEGNNTVEALPINAGIRDEINEIKREKRSLKFSNRARSDARASRQIDASLVGAPVLNLSTTGRAGVEFVNAPVPVKLSQSKQPLRVVLRDEQGTERVLSMRSVSFGAQELGRLNFNSRASVSAQEGVW